MAYKDSLPKLFLLAVFIAVLAGPVSMLHAQQGEAPIIIRDTEIEDTFKEWMAPLLKAAGIDKNGVHLVLVQSPQINAFVAGGSNIFIYTGLIDKTESPGEILGVLAHELGHIAGGHLVATRRAFERASYESILGTVLGIGAAIVTGDGGAATTIIAGSSSMAARGFLAHSRVQESSADQAALRFFESSAFNPRGLETFFEKLESEELLPSDQQSQYMRTHPLTRDRIDAVRQSVNGSPHKDEAFPPSWKDQHARMKAKLLSFINPGQVPWVYDDLDKSVPARYARAIAAYRNHNVEPALREMDGLLAMEPQNPYFLELKGQMLMDFGRVAEAVPFYKKSVDILPDSGLIRTAYGHALLESGDSNKATIQEAIDTLERAQKDEPRSTRIFRLLATAYGRLGQENMAKINLAEEAVLQRKIPYAKSQAESVLKASENGSREWGRARDILAHLETVDDEDIEEESP